MERHYLIIKTGYEGIDELCWLAHGEAEAIKEIKRFRKKDKEDWDNYCVQEWDGTRFLCVCNRLGVSPSQKMLR